MPLETKYELLYREQDNVCGDPFPEFVRFAESYQEPNATVLDLGCGQGRDAFVFARRGMTVTGVDISATGIKQMMDFANAHALQISGVVSDIREFTTEKRFDIIILDRTLHMLSNPNERMVIIRRCANCLSDSGYILIADEPSNTREFVNWFTTDSQDWKLTPRMKPAFCFAQLQNKNESGGG